MEAASAWGCSRGISPKGDPLPEHDPWILQKKRRDDFWLERWFSFDKAVACKAGLVPPGSSVPLFFSPDFAFSDFSLPSLLPHPVLFNKGAQRRRPSAGF